MKHLRLRNVMGPRRLYAATTAEAKTAYVRDLSCFAHTYDEVPGVGPVPVFSFG